MRLLVHQSDGRHGASMRPRPREAWRLDLADMPGGRRKPLQCGHAHVRRGDHLLTDERSRDAVASMRPRPREAWRFLPGAPDAAKVITLQCGHAHVRRGDFPSRRAAPCRDTCFNAATPT